MNVENTVFKLHFCIIANIDNQYRRDDVGEERRERNRGQIGMF